MWRIASVFLIALLFLGNSGNQSQQSPSLQPAKSVQQQTNSKNTEKTTTNDQRGTENSPIIIKVLPTKEIEKETHQAQKDRKEKTELDRKLTEYTKELSIFTEVLAVVAFFQLVVFGVQAWKLHQTVKATKESADAALKTAHHMEVAERAYIKISHTPSGLVRRTPLAEMLYGQNRAYEIDMEVRNIGKTPAELTRLSFSHILLPTDAPLPAIPPYNSSTEEEAIRAIMYGTDAIFPFPSFTVSVEDFEAINAGRTHFYVLGYADYIDHFGTHHRAGYARRYDPHATGNNLLIVTQPGYNYDERK